MLTENDIKLMEYYGDNKDGRRRIMAWNWNDGPRGVNYSIEDVRTFMPIFCSKAEFVQWANEGGIPGY